MIDLNLLRIMKHRSDFLRIKGRVPDTAIDAQTRAILVDFEHYFTVFPDHDRVDYQTFLPIFRSRHPTMSDDSRNGYETILTNAMTVDVSDQTRDGIMRNMLELRLGTQLASMLNLYDAGELPNIHHAMHTALEEFKADARIREIDFIQDDIGTLLQDEISDAGLRWRLECLNNSTRGLRGGDFGIIAGRPDKGKTTFISSELTFLAAQLPPGRTAVWLNNEGPGKRIIPRLYQAALGATMTDLIKMNAAGTIKDQYANLLGAIDRIRVVDIHSCDNFTVEGIVEKHNAGIVVYDMIDNIRGFGDAARTDLGLEKMYQWARELAVKYDHIGLATSQISAEGDGLQFPGMSMLKDSKTGKQGANDFMLMIGASNDVGLSGVRYLGMPKNKLRREGGPGDPRATVKYDPSRSRYEDIPYAADPNVEAPE